jgi:hypothetical protein
MLRHGLSTAPLLAVSAALLVTGCAGGGSSPASTSNAPTLGVAQRGATTLPRTIDGIVVPSGVTLPTARSVSGAGWMEQAARPKPKVYVADQGNSAIRSYRQKGTNQQPIGEITNGLNDVDGLFVDSSKNLYACNFNNGTVTVYKPGTTSPSETLTGAGQPKFSVVAPNGDVYVANFNEGTDGTVLEYDKGQTTPTRTVVTFGAGTFPEGLALDSSNNLYVAYNTNDGEVLEFAGGSGTGTNLGIHVTYVGGLTIDKKNALYLADQVNHTVNVYPAGSNTPSLKITGITSAYGVSLNAKNNQIYITGAFTPKVWRAALPAGTINDTITADLASAFGVATSPSGQK